MLCELAKSYCYSSNIFVAVCELSSIFLAPVIYWVRARLCDISAMSLLSCDCDKASAPCFSSILCLKADAVRRSAVRYKLIELAKYRV